MQFKKKEVDGIGLLDLPSCKCSQQKKGYGTEWTVLIQFKCQNKFLNPR